MWQRGELEVLSAALSSPSAGGSAALVVRGEPGVGKTASWPTSRQVMAQGHDVTLLATTATRPSPASPSACSGCCDRCSTVSTLPARQAAALRSALALGPATDPDRFAVATATLSLLAVAAQRGPLIVSIDDWHWLDPASAQALAFAARRRPGPSRRPRPRVGSRRYPSSAPRPCGTHRGRSRSGGTSPWGPVGWPWGRGCSWCSWSAPGWFSRCRSDRAARTGAGEVVRHGNAGCVRGASDAPPSGPCRRHR